MIFVAGIARYLPTKNIQEKGKLSIFIMQQKFQELKNNQGTHLKGPKCLRPQFLLLLHIFTVRNVQDSFMLVSKKIWVTRSTLKCFNGKLWHECVDIFSHIFSLNNLFNGILSTDDVEYFVVNILKIQISLMTFRGNQKMGVCIVWVLNSDRHISLTRLDNDLKFICTSVLEAISNVLHYNPDFKTVMGGKIFKGTHLKGPKLLRPQFLLLLYIFTVRNVQDSYMLISEKIWVKRRTLKCYNGKLWHECVDIFSHIFSLNNLFNGILSTDDVEYFVVNILKIKTSLMTFR
jgi:hypothetical protein